MTSSHSDSNIRKATVTALAVIILLYLGQGVIYWVRLNQIDAVKIELNSINETCNDINCTATWRFAPNGKFLLLGHVLRTHRLHLEDSLENLIPISTVRGTSADSWASLRVYRVEPGKTYILEATKYKTIRMGYFIGLLPRTTNHEGILSIPDIGPTISTMAGLLGFILMVLMFAAAYLGNSRVASRGSDHFMLGASAAAAVLASLASFISIGALDTLLPEGEVRNKTLRLSVFVGMLLPVIAQIPWVQQKNSKIRLILGGVFICILGSALWPWIRGGATWAYILTGVTILGIRSLVYVKHYLAAIILGTTLFDVVKILGWVQYPDYPPVYLYSICIFSSFTLFAGQIGGFATISLAGVAYRRFKRDLVLSAIQKSIENSANIDSTSKIAGLRSVLADISNLTGAGRVNITINLPLGRPITQSYDAASSNTKIFDDGRIPGPVTLRAMLYGDEALFESFKNFAARLKLPQDPAFQDSSFFCALPLKVNNLIIGTIILTRFNDEFLRKKNADNQQANLEEEKETIHLIAERISQSLSKLMVQDLNASAVLSKSLHQAVHRVIASSGSADDFLLRFAATVSKVCNVSVMIHEKVDDRGVALAQSGIAPESWDFFVKNPFNLSAEATPAYGSTVVAFRDGKSSYVKDVKEVYDRLHPKTRAIFDQMGVQSLSAVPLKSLDREFVISIITYRSQGPADPAITAVVESTEALFVASIEVMSQKTSVLALGQLASRLIGDDEVREKILDAAKSKNLPTTIGSPRVSFLLLFDLIGSSDLSQDTEVKARAYGDFYDAVNRKSQEVLGGMIRKTIGDAVIVTWDGTGVLLGNHPHLLGALEQIAAYADEVAKSIGCKGSRALLHHGRYFLGLVGTQTFGQIDVIGSGIDEVCKMESVMKTLTLSGKALKLAISETAFQELKSIPISSYKECGYIDLSQFGDSKFAIKYGSILNHIDSEVIDVA